MHRRQTLPPELDFLLDCARAQFKIEFPKLPVSGLNWDLVVAAAAYHGLIPLVHERVFKHGSGVVAAETSNRLELRRNEIARRNIFLSGRLLKLFERFESAGVPVIPLKGPPLAELLYGDLTMRTSLDLDLLVRREDVIAAVELLESQGYLINSELGWVPLQFLVERECEVVYSRSCGTHIDLHWEVAASDYPFRLEAESLWSAVTSQSFFGRTIPTLPAEDQLLFLCMHGAKHNWACLQWICDVARMAERMSGDNWDNLLGRADVGKYHRILLLGLGLTNELLGAVIPDRVQVMLAEDRVVQTQMDEVLRTLVELRLVPPSGLDLVRFNAKLAERFWDRIRLYAGLLKAPQEADARVLRLPPRLFFLYYPFRAARLALKYTLGANRGG